MVGLNLIWMVVPQLTYIMTCDISNPYWTSNM